jgi:uncharacterized membrane protein YczE
MGGACVILASLGASGYDSGHLGTHCRTSRPSTGLRPALEWFVLTIGWLLGGEMGPGAAAATPVMPGLDDLA